MTALQEERFEGCQLCRTGVWEWPWSSGGEGAGREAMPGSEDRNASSSWESLPSIPFPSCQTSGKENGLGLSGGWEHGADLGVSFGFLQFKSN